MSASKQNVGIELYIYLFCDVGNQIYNVIELKSDGIYTNVMV